MAIWSWLQLLAVPAVLLGAILFVAWRQERRRPSTRRRASGLRKVRWSHGSASHRFGQSESGSPSSGSGTGPGQGPHDRPTYLD